MHLPETVTKTAASGAESGPIPVHLTHETYRTFNDACHLRQQWNALAERIADVSGSHDWCRIWWRHFGTGRRLEIHSFRQGDRLVAVLPLFHETMRPAGVWLRTVRLVGCDYDGGAASLVVEPQHARQVARALLDSLSARDEWDVLQCGPLRNYIDVAEPLARAWENHHDVQAVINGRDDQWLTMFDLPETYEAYLEGLGGRERRDTRRLERNLCQGREVSVETITRPEQVQSAMDSLVHLHQQLWRGRGQRGHFGSIAAVEDFYREAAQCFVGSGKLALITIRVDGQIVGADLGFRFGPRTHGVCRGYLNDEHWRKFGLGRLLHCAVVRQAIQCGSTQVEAGRGVFDHKLRLGGRLVGERSLAVVRQGSGRRLRFWLALRAAYLIHVAYNRVWADVIAPPLGIRTPERHFYVRYRMLAQLFRRTRFRLFGGPRFVQAAPAAVPRQ